MQTATTPSRPAQKRRNTAFVLIAGFLLLILGIVCLFSLSGKSVRFDSAYDAGEDLSPYFFDKLEDGQQYSPLQSAWLALARYRVWPIVAGVLLIALYVALNRHLLYSQKVAPYVFVMPFILTFAVFFVYPLASTVLMSFQEITGSGSTWIGLENYRNMFANKTFYTAVINSLRYMVIYGFEKVDKFGFASAVGLVLLVGAMIITVAQLWITGTIGKRREL